MLLRRLLLLASVIVGIQPLAICSGFEFSRRFAPHNGMVTEYEYPQRQELCLNGLWQFQPVEVPSDWVSDQGTPPLLQMPKADQWETMPIKIPSAWNVNN